jgi:hypothetical protein
MQVGDRLRRQAAIAVPAARGEGFGVGRINGLGAQLCQVVVRVLPAGQSWSNRLSLLESRNKDPRPLSLLVLPESEYRGTAIVPRERRTGTACSAAKP